MNPKLCPVRKGLLMAAALIIFASSDVRPQSDPIAAAPLDPIATIVEAFRTHSLVALGEGNHNNEQGHQFRLELLRDPRFATVVNDIVVECGNARYQDVIDRFISGNDVPDDSLYKVWQNTTQPQAVWDVPIYEEFFRAVRDLNRQLPVGRRLRVLLGDPPIDWETIHSREDMGRWIGFSDRDASPADIVQREVLSKQRRALIMYGDMHFQRKNILANYDMSAPVAQTLTSRLEHTGPVFTIWTNTNIDLRTAQANIAAWPTPSLTMLRGSVLGAQDFTFYLPGEGARIAVKDGKPAPIPRAEWRSLKMEDQFDALLYLGSPASITMSRLSPALCADTAYMQMRLWRMSLAPFPAGPANPVDRLKQYCATVQAR
jgi:hypothetical protein